MPIRGPRGPRSASARGYAIGATLMVASMLAFACMDTITKYVVRDYGVAQVLFVRSCVFTCFAAVLACRGPGLWRTLRSRRPWVQAGRAALAVVESATFVLAFRYLPLADAHSVGSSSPLFVVALSAPLLGERVGRDRWLAVIAGFAGVLLIIRPGFTTLNAALLLPLTGAALWGLYQILIRLCSRTDSNETTLLWSAWVGLVLTSFVGLPNWTPPTGLAWAMLAAIALLGCLGYLALTVALAAAIQPYSYTLLLFVTVLGMVVYGDVPDRWTVAGGAIVVASGLYAWHRERAIRAAAA
jgi:drug/metabolite transporter (DMT)-like permease